MDICKEKKNLGVAKNNLKIAKELLPGIIKDAKLGYEYEEMLWEKIDVRQKEIDRRDRIIKAKKNQLANLGSEQSFTIENEIRVIRYSSTEGKIIIEDGKSEPIPFSGNSFSYICHLAEKSMDDNTKGKSHFNVGWLKDEDLGDYYNVNIIRIIRSRIKDDLKIINPEYEKLIEKAYINIHNKNKGFRISSPYVIVEDKSLEG